MKQLAPEQENELIRKNEIFFCIDSSGYGSRFKPKNNAESLQMHVMYPLVVQIGFRCSDEVIVGLEDSSKITVNPNNYKLGTLYNNVKKIITSRKIKTIWLEPEV